MARYRRNINNSRYFTLIPEKVEQKESEDNGMDKKDKGKKV